MDEEQFVLRLPSELSQRMRFALASKAKRDAAVGAAVEPGKFSIRFVDDRNARFILDGAEYPATLMDLPCVTETHKYTEKRTFYKSGDVGQVLVVRMPDDPPPAGTILPDGLTPASKGARDRFAVPDPIFKPEMVSHIENTLKLVVDNKLALVRKKPEAERADTADKDGVAVANGGTGHEEEIEIEIEGDVGAGDGKSKETVATGKPSGNGGVAKSGSATAPSSRPPSAPPAIPSSKPPSIPSSAPAASPVKDDKPAVPKRGRSPQPSPLASPAPSPSPLASPAPSPVDYGSSAALAGGTTPLASPGPEASPAPASELPEEEEDEDDDFADMVAESMLDTVATDAPGGGDPVSAAAAAQARIALADAQRRVDEKRSEVAQQDAAAARAPNPVLKDRHLRRRADLAVELTSLEKKLAELGPPP